MKSDGVLSTLLTFGRRSFDYCCPIGAFNRDCLTDEVDLAVNTRLDNDSIAVLRRVNRLLDRFEGVMLGSRKLKGLPSLVRYVIVNMKDTLEFISPHIYTTAYDTRIAIRVRFVGSGRKAGIACIHTTR